MRRMTVGPDGAMPMSPNMRRSAVRPGVAVNVAQCGEDGKSNRARQKKNFVHLWL